MLGFDVDAETLWTYRGMVTPTPVSRGQYDVFVAVPRILALLKKYDIRATFFIPGWVVLRYQDMVKNIAAGGHELGHHGWLHHDPNGMPPEQEAAEFEMGIEAFLDVAGMKPRGYRSPSFDLSPHTLGILRNHGYIYDSSMMASERPYYVEEESGECSVLEIPVAWELDDAPYFLFNFSPAYRVGMTDPRVVEYIWRSEIEAGRREHGYVNLTMHPQIIGRHHRLQLLEDLIRHAQRLGDVRFGTLGEVACEAANPNTPRIPVVARWTSDLNRGGRQVLTPAPKP
jgi:peptidoglycan/xylan/chitin deacetylase (PgdA/CDA1 family)